MFAQSNKSLIIYKYTISLIPQIEGIQFWGSMCIHFFALGGVFTPLGANLEDISNCTLHALYDGDMSQIWLIKIPTRQPTSTFQPASRRYLAMELKALPIAQNWTKTMHRYPLPFQGFNSTLNQWQHGTQHLKLMFIHAHT